MSRPKPAPLPLVANCDDCCACCMHMDYPAFVQENDAQPAEPHWTSLPQRLKEQLLRHIANHQEPAKGRLGGPCCWLDLESRRCKHHQHRPNVCRDFKIGGSDCLGWRREYEVDPG